MAGFDPKNTDQLGSPTSVIANAQHLKNEKSSKSPFAKPKENSQSGPKNDISNSFVLVECDLNNANRLHSPSSRCLNEQYPKNKQSSSLKLTKVEEKS